MKTLFIIFIFLLNINIKAQPKDASVDTSLIGSIKPFIAFGYTIPINEYNNGVKIDTNFYFVVCYFILVDHRKLIPYYKKGPSRLTGSIVWEPLFPNETKALFNSVSNIRWLSNKYNEEYEEYITLDNSGKYARIIINKLEK